MHSRFEDLELQNASIGKLKMHMSAFQDENEIQPCLDLEEQKRCIDEIIVNKEKWLQSQIANGEDLNEGENTAANQGLLQNNGSSRWKLRLSWSQETRELFWEVLRMLSKH